MKPTTRYSLLLALCLQALVATKTLGEGDETWTVDLKQGSIKAQRSDLCGGRHYYTFRTIPFAKPPVGPLRFKNPEPADSWSGVRNGSAETSPCAQLDIRSFFTEEKDIIGSEDCLYLNVYSPGPDASGLPVMVWIHGGAFIIGDAATYEPSHLMRKDVVVVVIQYRLNVFGFMSTEDSVIPGNIGLKDQVMALHWVKENIRSFGGDPDSVTIFGESAGGISVHLLMLSPMAKGLFHKVIAQSGTALIPNLIRDDHRTNAAIMGQMLECEGVNPENLDSQALYDCLQDIPAKTLVVTSLAFAKLHYGPQVMVPGVDGEFLPEHPAILIKRGEYHRVDFMAGINRDEGALYVRPMLLNNATSLALAQNFSVNGPSILNLGREGDLGLYMSKRMFYHYLGGLMIDEETAEGAVKLFTDYLFGVPMDIVAKMHLRDAVFGSRTYLYELHYVGEFAFMDNPNITIGKNWCNHVDEIQYLFSSPLLGTIKEPKNLFVRDIVISLWTNFARTGNPTPDMSLGFKWPAISGNELRYLLLKPSPCVRGFTREKEMEFMTNLPMKGNKILFPDRFRNKEGK